MEKSKFESKKKILRDIFADSGRFEDGVSQLRDWVVNEEIKNECILYTNQFYRVSKQQRLNLLSLPEFNRELDKIIFSILELIIQLKLQDVKSDEAQAREPLKALILTTEGKGYKRFNHYFKERFVVPDTIFEINTWLEFKVPKGFDFLIFDGNDLPRSRDTSEPNDTVDPRIKLMKDYLQPDKYEGWHRIPMLFFGPNRTELYNYPEQYVAANSWITLHTRTQELVSYLKQLRLTNTKKGIFEEL
ncbi:MAG: hypothetical protein MRZ79_17640 [Bacteroidia bacterium]|nr:hypothetical protein [Bacteroidia bacterium]